MSKRNEKAKRLNANEDNLLQKEMDRFEKQHNREMKSILLERQVAKEAMSDIRRHRASSLLAARMVLQENNALNNDHTVDNSPTLPTEVYCETKLNRLASKTRKSSETHEIMPPVRPKLTQKSQSGLDWKFSENGNVSLLPSRGNDQFGRSRKRAQTFSEGTVDIRSDLEGGSSSLTKLEPLTIPRKLTNHWQQHGDSVAKDMLTVTTEDVVDNDIDSRPRSRSDNSVFYKRLSKPSIGYEKVNLTVSKSPGSRGNSHEPNSPSLARTPTMNRRVSLDVSRLLLKRGSLLEVPSLNVPLPPNKLSPSRGIARFRQTGSAAAAAQTLLSRYQREKAISKATENLIVEQEKREKVRQEHQQMKEDWRKAGRMRTTGLKERFFTIAQLVVALNALKTAASKRSSFAEEIE